MRTFRIDIPAADVEDLHRRLDATRWPREVAGAGWTRGVPVEYLTQLTDYWRTKFDWRAAEAEINSHPQFRTEIDGVDVHFLHVRSPEPSAVPLILTHGWPSSFVEFLDVIGPLTDPARYGGDPGDAFHVVIPSIPGYGFSAAPTDAGWDVPRVARAWAELMSRLGYDRYVAQGGDWGKVISLRLAQADPEHVLGVHLNMLVTFPPDTPDAFDGLDQRDLGRLQRAGWFQQDGLGWAKIQSTRPQTLAYGLTDSPAGQLAWIVEKFWEWTDSPASPEDAVHRDRLLTNASVYWFTATAGPSAQLYFESTHTDADFVGTWAGPWPVAAPVAVAVFPHDATPPIRRFAEGILPTLSRWTEFDKGGHFAALEQPGPLVEDIREFSRSLRRTP